MSKKIVVLGSCSVDFTTYAPRLPKSGETLHGTKFNTSYGGKGANQCVAAAKLGGKVSMISRVGDDQWGHLYIKHLIELGVDVSNVKITPNVTTGIAQISVAENGENQIVIVPGANSHLSIEDIKESKDCIINADLLIGQLETPLEPTLEAFKLCKGLKLLNAAPARVDIQEILQYCDILCVNESEASLIANLPVVNIENAAVAVQILIGKGCNMVIVTLGDKGAVYASKQDHEPVHVLCRAVSPVDTTGAGDAFVGALATYLTTHNTHPMFEIIGAACEVATISVTKEGTQTSYPNKFDAFNKKYEFIKLVK